MLLWVMDLELAQLGLIVEVGKTCTPKSAVFVKRALLRFLHMSLVDWAGLVFGVSPYSKSLVKFSTCSCEWWDLGKQAGNFAI